MIGIFMNSNDASMINSLRKSSQSRDVIVRSTSKKRHRQNYTNQLSQTNYQTILSNQTNQQQEFQQNDINNTRQLLSQNENKWLFNTQLELNSTQNLQQNYQNQQQVREISTANIYQSRDFSQGQLDQFSTQNTKSDIRIRNVRPQSTRNKPQLKKSKSRSNSNSRLLLYEKQLQQQIVNNSSALNNYKSLLNIKNKSKQERQSTTTAMKFRNLKQNYLPAGSFVENDPITKEIQKLIAYGSKDIKSQSKKLKKNLEKIQEDRRIKSPSANTHGSFMIETSQDLHRKNQFYDQETIHYSKKIDKLKQKTAQAQSDKLELMRDIATYESNLCEDLNLRSMFKMMRDKVMKCKEKSTQLNKSHNKFQEFLIATKNKLAIIDETKRTISLLIEEPDDQIGLFNMNNPHHEHQNLQLSNLQLKLAFHRSSLITNTMNNLGDNSRKGGVQFKNKRDSFNIRCNANGQMGIKQQGKDCKLKVIISKKLDNQSYHDILKNLVICFNSSQNKIMLALNETSIMTRDWKLYKLKGKNKYINARLAIEETTLQKVLVFFKIVNMAENQTLIHDSNLYIVHQEYLDDDKEFNFNDFLIKELSGNSFKVVYIKDINDDMDDPQNLKLYNSGNIDEIINQSLMVDEFKPQDILMQPSLAESIPSYLQLINEEKIEKIPEQSRNTDKLNDKRFSEDLLDVSGSYGEQMSDNKSQGQLSDNNLIIIDKRSSYGPLRIRKSSQQ
ncbi:UNKNOWN [Stylonychia lemnae]|uniref:Uncharacterized protein n=1 Tax=Stylonychia lemnae TaxID=5949 RepID=A0A078B1N7_STYLE|nr:UNKNOWN [Stylonychia lemnae]|eukprot:CDW87237.1 UNKNOWN [Stylonychia lemnae]